jgi:hypothetical protein
MSSGKDRLRLDPTEYRDELAGSRSGETAPLFAAKRNHKLHRDSRSTESAADLQQTLSFKLNYPPSPTPSVFGASRVLGKIGLDDLEAPFEVARLDRPDEGVDQRRYRGRFARVMAPAASAEVTAFIAGPISAALSIGGNSNLTVRSRQGGRTRSMQSRIAVGSPARASSTVLLVKTSDCLQVVLRRHESSCCENWPADRRGGPIGPFRTAARAPASVVLVKAHQS